MRKILGLAAFLLALMLITPLWELGKSGAIRFYDPMNIKNLLTWVGLFGILSLGQAFVIITGGIDLSVGSLVALVGVIAARYMAPDAAVTTTGVLAGVLLLCAIIGLFHGLLITKIRIQPFVVTLCGLFFYRGLARVITGDSTQGFGNSFLGLKWLGRGSIWNLLSDDAPGSAVAKALDCVPAPFLLLLAIGAAVGAFLHFAPAGRHLFALGANEDGARFSGIRTDRLKIAAYVLCSLISGIGGLLIAFKVNSMQPSSFGSFYELYAIAGAVLGGCSLRGGSGNLIGILIGATILRVLTNMVTLLGIPNELEFMVIGAAILVGVGIDELFGRRKARVRTRKT